MLIVSLANGVKNPKFDDGDTISCKPVWTKEANKDAERYINSNAYVIDIRGQNMRKNEQVFVLAQYTLTNVSDPSVLTKDCNKVTPKYIV